MTSSNEEIAALLGEVLRKQNEHAVECEKRHQASINASMDVHSELRAIRESGERGRDLELGMRQLRSESSHDLSAMAHGIDAHLARVVLPLRENDVAQNAKLEAIEKKVDDSEKAREARAVEGREAANKRVNEAKERERTSERRQALFIALFGIVAGVIEVFVRSYFRVH